MARSKTQFLFKNLKSGHTGKNSDEGKRRKSFRGHRKNAQSSNDVEYNKPKLNMITIYILRLTGLENLRCYHELSCQVFRIHALRKHFVQSFVCSSHIEIPISRAARKVLKRIFDPAKLTSICTEPRREYLRKSLKIWGGRALLYKCTKI